MQSDDTSHDPTEQLHTETLSPPPSHAPLQDAPPSRRKRSPKGKHRRPQPLDEVSGECHLLALPVDVLQVLLSRIPPRSLLALSATCRSIRLLLDETVWRQSYVNRFLYDGATREDSVKDEVRVLVQPCGPAERGWRRESLAREAMIDRWTNSKTSPMIHYPPVGLIHSLSLSYPPPVVTDTPPRTQRERYEALAPRPPPYVLSAGLDVGVVRSDPLTAKVSKGFWCPTGFHLRPHHDHPPSAMYLPPRNQSHVLWGLLAGDVVHTSVRSAQKGRASHSVFSKPGYSHEGAVLDIHSSDPEGNVFVTAGEDGRVKLWRLEPGKRGHIACVWSSSFATPQENRSDAVKLRQAQRPDPIILARCDGDVVAGVTEDGDLRVWLGVGGSVGGSVREVRVDVGEGKVKQMELQGTSVLIRHDRSETFARYDIGEEINVTHFDAATPITSLQAFLQPSLAITMPSTASFGRLVVGGDDAGGVHIWSWDGDGAPVRSWPAAKGRITAIDYSCGLVAVASHDGYISIFDPLPSPPLLLRSFLANHLSSADATIAASDRFDARYYTVNRLILENDVVVASIGRKVFAWRAGTAKGRQAGKKDTRRPSGGRGEFKAGGSRGLDMKALHREAEDDHEEIRQHNAATRVPNRRETQELEAMEHLGLDGGDEALQYALMLSMEQPSRNGTASPSWSPSPSPSPSPSASPNFGPSPAFSPSPSPSVGPSHSGYGSEGEDEAIRAVEEFTRNEERQMREAMEVIRRSEGNGE